jgi:GNAT superfamily N-acetyltransferase
LKQITISPLKIADIDQLIDVAQRAWHAHYPGIITAEQIDYMLELGYNRAVIMREITEEGITWLSIMDGETMIGLISAGPYGADAIKLHKLYVLPEYHGKGIGAMALARVEQVAREACAHKIVLNVNKRNAKAIRAYERAGWRIAEEVVNDIGNGHVMDDFVMTKQIN